MDQSQSTSLSPPKPSSSPLTLVAPFSYLLCPPCLQQLFLCGRCRIWSFIRSCWKYCFLRPLVSYILVRLWFMVLMIITGPFRYLLGLSLVPSGWAAPNHQYHLAHLNLLLSVMLDFQSQIDFNMSWLLKLKMAWSMWWFRICLWKWWYHRLTSLFCGRLPLYIANRYHCYQNSSIYTLPNFALNFCTPQFG